MSEARSSKVSTGDYPIARLEARYPTNFYFGRQISRPRHALVRDREQADELLRLWTPSGRISRR
jgi:hypothetical protein